MPALVAAIWAVLRYALKFFGGKFLVGIATLLIGVAAYATDTLQDLFFWVIIQFFELFFALINIAAAKIGAEGVNLDIGAYLQQLPTEILALLGYLKIPEAFGVISCGMAVKVCRKVLIRA